MARIAFYTFAVLHEAIPHPRVQGFVNLLATTWATVDAAPGFIARSTREDEWGKMLNPRFYDAAVHPAVPAGLPPIVAAPATLSLWRDVHSVHAFAYGGIHLAALEKRRDWFRIPEWPTYVAWWVEDDETPTWQEACGRLEQLHDNGPSPQAFTFKQPYDAHGQPLELKRSST